MLDVAVAGGGIGGLTTALAFAQRGAKVVLFEKAAAFQEVGAGLQVTPNGARVLEALGLGPALDKQGIRAEAVVPMDALSGRQIARFDLTDQTPRYRFVHRARLLSALVEGAVSAGIELRTGTEVLAAEPDGSFETTQGPGRADLVVFADGLHSVGRGAISSGSEPFFTGQIAWRAVVPGQAEPVARIWMAPGRHVVTYPLSDSEVNVVAVEERNVWTEEGWHHPVPPEHLQETFADCCADLTGLLDQANAVHLWGLFRHPVAAQWHKGSLCLVGDAAHPTLPFLAQGANLALEDAFVLAGAVSDAATLNDGLARYQALRQPRVARAITAANANARNYHLSGLSRRVAHTGLRTMGRLAPNAFLKRYSWLYDHDVTRLAG